MLEGDLFGDSASFEFVHFELSKIDICTSTSYSFPRAGRMDNILAEILREDDRMMMKPTNSPIFFNLIPGQERLNVIVGQPKEDKFKWKINLANLIKLNDDGKREYISDVLIKHVETWFVSQGCMLNGKN